MYKLFVMQCHTCVYTSILNCVRLLVNTTLYIPCTCGCTFWLDWVSLIWACWMYLYSYVNMCIHMNINIMIHTCMHTSTCKLLGTCIHTGSENVYVHVHAFICMWLWIHIQIIVHKCMYIYICTYTNTYTYTYIYL